jgi:DNA-binding NarL/FixJ family response regulator
MAQAYLQHDPAFSVTKATAGSKGPDRVATNRSPTRSAKRAGAAKPISIVVVDDHCFMRELISRMLGRHADRYKVVAEAGDATTAFDVCATLQPDLLILDINLPDESGIDAVPKLKKLSPHTRILLCTAYVTDDRVLDALRCGADGFVEKTNTWDDFVAAIDRVSRGEHYFSSRNSMALGILPAGARAELRAKSTAGLSARQKEVLSLVAQGCSSKEVADKLGISVGTVDVHRVNLMKKLHIKNVAGLAVFAFRAGLIR